MLAMLVSKGNLCKAETTAAAYAAQAVGLTAVLGIQMDDLIRTDASLEDFFRNRRSEPWRQVYVWDRSCDDAWQSLRDLSLPQPFYSGKDVFSYGGAFNRQMLLALLAGVPELVRVDAGTAPRDQFAASLKEHLALLDRYTVISGRYDGRVALRDDFLPEGDRSAFHMLVRRRMGIDPLCQITGGACFALRVKEGPPAIAFPGFLPIWGSDDALFQSVASSVVNREMIVQRKEPGQPLTGPEYPARLAGAAALTAVHQQASLCKHLIPTRDVVVASGKAFLDEFRSLFPNTLSASDHGGAMCRLEERALGLILGYENYCELKPRWGDVCNHVVKMASKLRGCCMVDASLAER
jgi:hypothetical protein